jgi:hypothetical protein
VDGSRKRTQFSINQPAAGDSIGQVPAGDGLDAIKAIDAAAPFGGMKISGFETGFPGAYFVYFLIHSFSTSSLVGSSVFLISQV